MSTPELSPPRRQAVALSYDPSVDGAPVIAAVGQGDVAEEIVRCAREAGVPIKEDGGLAAALGQLNLGEAIPPELYLVIAEVLAYVFRLEARLARRR